MGSAAVTLRHGRQRYRLQHRRGHAETPRRPPTDPWVLMQSHAQDHAMLELRAVVADELGAMPQLRNGEVVGLVLGMLARGMLELVLDADADAAAPPGRKIAWGKKVSAAFKAKLIEVAAALQVDPDFLMAAMAFESAESFSGSKKNAAGSGATGLIQFMPSTARGLNTTTAELAAMGEVKQLDYVKAYFSSYAGKLKTVDDVYMVILWPRAVGKSGDYVLFDRDDKKHPLLYAQNKGLDADRDGQVTKDEAAAQVKRMLVKGRSAEWLG